MLRTVCKGSINCYDGSRVQRYLQGIICPRYARKLMRDQFRKLRQGGREIIEEDIEAYVVNVIVFIGVSTTETVFSEL